MSGVDDSETSKINSPVYTKDEEYAEQRTDRKIGKKSR